MTTQCHERRAAIRRPLPGAVQAAALVAKGLITFGLLAGITVDAARTAAARPYVDPPLLFGDPCAPHDANPTPWPTECTAGEAMILLPRVQHDENEAADEPSADVADGPPVAM